MRKKLLSILLAVCLVLTLLPTVAFATETTGTFGGFSVTYADGTAPSYSNSGGVLTFGTVGEYTVSMADGENPTSDRIVINASGAVKLNLNGVKIQVPAASSAEINGANALTVESGTVTLNVTADSSLTGGNGALIDPMGDSNGNGGSGVVGNVTITGAATLTVTGGIGGSAAMGISGTGGAGISGDVAVTGAVTLTAIGGIGGTSVTGTSGTGGAGISGNVAATDSASLIAIGGQYGGGIANGGNGISGSLTVTDHATVSLEGGLSSSTPGSALTGTLTATSFTLKGGFTGLTDEITSSDSRLNQFRYLSVEPLPNVAEIGSTGYPTLQAAVDAVAEGQTIKLLDNVTVTDSSSITISGANSFTLDLNGKTLDGGSGNTSLIKHTGSGTLTIKDSGPGGKMTSKRSVAGDAGNIGTVGTAELSAGNGNLTLLSGTIENSSDLGSGIFNNGTGTVSIQDGAVKANECGVNNKSGNVSVSGGVVSANKYLSAAISSSAGKVTLSGGSIYNPTYVGVGLSNSSLVVSGGSPVIQGGTAAMNVAPTVDSDTIGKVTASTSYDGSNPVENYDAGKITTYKYLTFVVKVTPTAAEYAAASPSAAPGTDYVLDDTVTPHTLTIYTAKGAAWWSANSAEYCNYTVLLAADIDVSAFQWSPVGNFGSAFTGSFNGQGHGISGLTVDVSGIDSAYAGLFGCAENATIKNVGLIDAQVSAKSSSYSAFAGGIVGFGDTSSIVNCYVIGNVSASSNSDSISNTANAGGIASNMISSTSENCYSAAKVSAAAYSATVYTGGIVAFPISGFIADSYYLAGSVPSDKGFNTYSSPTVTGCGTFDANGVLMAGTAAQFQSAQTLAFGNALLAALNGWVSGQASTDYYTWKADSTPNTNGGYPVFSAAWAEPRAQWGVAGTENAAPGTWVGSGSLTDALEYANDLESGTAYIQLLSDVDTTAALEFAENKTTVLDLKGKTIDGNSIPTGSGVDRNVLTVNGNLTLCDSSTTTVAEQGKITGGHGNGDGTGGGVYIANSGTLTMTGGNVTGNTAMNGGGVANEGTFNMTGGSIAGNSCISGTGSMPCGGGVVNLGTFNMSGGSITDNTVVSGGAGGGVLDIAAGMTLSGNVNISGNTVGTASDNVALTDAGSGGAGVVIAGALTNSTAIGVSIVQLSNGAFTPKAGVFTFGNAVTNSNYISKFVSDNSGFAIVEADDSQLKLAAAQAITKADATNGSFTVKVNGNQVPSAIEGQTVTVTPTANANYELDTITVTKTGDTSTTVSVSSNTFTMPTYAVTVSVTFKAKSANTGGTGSGSNSASSGTGAPVIVDGKTENIGTEKKSGGTTTVTVDQSKLGTNIGGAASGSSVVVPVSENGSATASLVVKNIEDMAAKGMTLTVQTGGVAYNLNTSAIDTAALTAAFPGADMSKVPFDVTIANSSVSVEGETLVLSPVEFTVTATYDGKTVEVDTFSAYIDRVIEVTAEQAAKITTAVVVNADGSIRHVPTNVIEKDGKYYAVISSRTNSTYALIQNEVTFSDAKGKWYEAAVNEMGSRKIIAGRSASAFDGDASITRAEFAVILVRALGLPADGISTFSDVPADAWYTGAVATAAQYGIVSGKGDNQFDPNANITRQEAMLMLQRAAALTEFTGAAGNLDSFTDADSVGSWARDAAKWSVGSGLIQGSGGKLNPTANITRAESATIILRLLQKASLVDVRSKD